MVIAGDTGAGKTSLLDAICFALYARTPELGRPGGLLTLGRTQGEVRLTFARGDEVWRVTRRFGKDAPDPLHLLERLDGDGGAPVATIAGQAEVDARLAALVGLGFEAFTSAVILAQGRFAEFLQAPPRRRDDILRELFGVASLDAAREAATRIAAGAEQRAGLRASDRARLPDHSQAARRAAAAEARHATAAAARLAGAAPLAARARAAAARAAALDVRERELEDALGPLPGEAGLAEVAALAREAETACTAARGRRRAAEEAAAGARAARDAARERHGGSAGALEALRGDAGRLRALEAILPEEEGALAATEAAAAAAREELAARAALADRARLAESLQAARGRREVASDEADRLAMAAVAAEAGAAAALREVERARRTLADIERLHAAAAIRRALAPGDPCPVCGSPVGEGTQEEPPGLGDAEAALEAARGAARAAEAAAADARARAAAAAAALEQARRAEEGAARALAEAGGERGDDPERLRAAAGGVDADRAAAERERGALAERRRRLERDREEVAGLRTRLGRWAAEPDPAEGLAAAIAEVAAAEHEADAAAGAAAEAQRAERVAAEAREALERSRVAPVRQAAALLTQRLGAPLPEPGLPAAELLAEAGRLAAAAREAAAAARREGDAAREEAEDLAGRLRAAVGDLGVAGPEDLAAAAQRGRAERERARAALARVEEAARLAGDLLREERVCRARAARAAQVARDLNVNNFPRYLLRRYRERLAAGASARLEELTGGAFRFAGEGADPLQIVDRPRGERRRPPETLSGGERFLASLALALGLGDVAAESGGRLECLFLDEGFSTLDAESLELALAGVERLAGGGRLVGVITHLPGVAERLGTAIRVAKDAAGISKVVR